MGKKGTLAYKHIDESVIDIAAYEILQHGSIRCDALLCRVVPKCVDLLIASYHEANAAVGDYPPDSPQHRKAEVKAVAARKSMNEYAVALQAWAEMLATRVEKDTKEGERKCLN